jgi:hypothetical protein
MGHLAQAIEMHELSVAAHERVPARSNWDAGPSMPGSGFSVPSTPDTLVSRNNLGVAYMDAGRVPEAIAEH